MPLLRRVDYQIIRLSELLRVIRARYHCRSFIATIPFGMDSLAITVSSDTALRALAALGLTLAMWGLGNLAKPVLNRYRRRRQFRQFRRHLAELLADAQDDSTSSATLRDGVALLNMQVELIDRILREPLPLPDDARPSPQ